MPRLTRVPVPDWLRRHHRAVLVGALALVFVWQWAVTLREPRDFGVYHTAGARLLRGEPIYDLRDDPAAAYKYSPAFGLLFVPLSLVPVKVAQTIWFAVNFGLTLLLPALAHAVVGRLGEERAASSAYRFWASAIALALGLRYVLLNAAAGQVVALQLALMLGGVALVERDRPWRGGALLGLAVLVKISPVLLLGHLALQRRWKGVGATIAAAALWALAPALLYGLRGDLQLHLEWLRFVQVENTLHQMTRPQNQSLLSLLTRLVVRTPYGLELADLPFAEVVRWYGPLLFGGFLALLAALWGWVRGASTEVRAERLRVGFIALLTYLTVVGPLSWRYNFLAVVVAWVHAADHVLRGHRTPRTVPLALVSVAMGVLTTRDVSRALETWTHLFAVETWAQCLAVVVCFDLLASAERARERGARAMAASA